MSTTVACLLVAQALLVAVLWVAKRAGPRG